MGRIKKTIEPAFWCLPRRLRCQKCREVSGDLVTSTPKELEGMCPPRRCLVRGREKPDVGLQLEHAQNSIRREPRWAK